MILTGIVNILAGAYKGYTDAAGQNVSPAYLGYVLASTSFINGVTQYFAVKKKNEDAIHQLTSLRTQGKNAKKPNPAAEGVTLGLKSIPICALEMIVGYAIGYGAQKLVS